MNDDEMEAQMEYWKSKAKAAEAERDRLKAKWENAAYDARSWERNCMDEINRAEDLQSEVARLRAVISAKDELLTAYRIGSHAKADRALAKLEALAPKEDA